MCLRGFSMDLPIDFSIEKRDNHISDLADLRRKSLDQADPEVCSSDVFECGPPLNSEVGEDNCAYFNEIFVKHKWI